MKPTDIFGTVATMFENWWRRTGRHLDPDTSDVSWFDKRRGLAEAAYQAGMATGANYVADDMVLPTQFAFANGRTIGMGEDSGCPILTLGLDRPIDPNPDQREPTERMIEEGAKSIVGHYAKEIWASTDEKDQLSVRTARIEAARCWRSMVACLHETPHS